MVKAAREAKLDTSWISVDEEYESALKAFVAALLDDTADQRISRGSANERQRCSRGSGR